MSDDLATYLRERLREPEFRAAFDDASERHRILDGLLDTRRQAGLTQTEVARRMGIGQPTVSELESESSDPRLSTLQRYARAVGGRIVVKFEPAPDTSSASDTRPATERNA